MPLSSCSLSARGQGLYDAGHFREFLMNNRIEPVIPSTALRKIKIPYDEVRYKNRNTVERMFGSLRDWRHVATRYDKLARNFFATIYGKGHLKFYLIKAA